MSWFGNRQDNDPASQPSKSTSEPERNTRATDARSERDPAKLRDLPPEKDPIGARGPAR